MAKGRALTAAALATLAADALVAAAVTDEWEDTRGKVARLFGHGRLDPQAERRLDTTRARLTAATVDEQQRVGAAEASRWATRFEDLLADHPEAEGELRLLTGEIRACREVKPIVSAVDHSLAAGGAISIEALDGVAAGVIHGTVAPIGRLGLERREVATRPVRLARWVKLTGREPLLADLHALLMESDDPWPRVAVLSGLGGVGKTSLAVEYAHRHLAKFEIVWQFAAENREVLSAGFSELFSQLGVREVLDTRDPVLAVHAALAARPTEWLFVFDNPPDASSLHAFLPPAGRGRILITSQNDHWPGWPVLEIPALDTDAAAGFLVSRTGDRDFTTAEELAAALGGLPLALEQAAAFVQASGSRLASCLSMFRQRQADLLNWGEHAGHHATVAATLAWALDRLDRDAPIATALLRLLACLAPEPTPARLLLASKNSPGEIGHEIADMLAPLMGDKDPVAFGNAIAALRRYSLVKSAGDDLVVMHKLVQATVLDHMDTSVVAKWRHAAATLTEDAIPVGIDRPERWPVCAVLLPHAQVTLPDDSAGMWRIAGYLGNSGNYKAARDLWRRISRAHERRSGPAHPNVLIARHELARLTGEAGDAAAARDMLAALLPDRLEFSGAEHPETLTTQASLARWTGEAGDAAAARGMFAALLSIRGRVLGDDHPQTLITQENLAHWTGEAGDAIAAREMFASLAGQHGVSGKEHLATLTIRAGLARWTGEAGDPATARDLLAALLPDVERELGAGHSYVLSVRGNLARWTGEAGDAAGARDMLAALRPACERVFGAEDSRILALRDDFFRWTIAADGSAG